MCLPPGVSKMGRLVAMGGRIYQNVSSPSTWNPTCECWFVSLVGSTGLAGSALASLLGPVLLLPLTGPV